MMKLKTNKTFTKNQEQKLKIKRIRTGVEIPTIKKDQTGIFKGEDRKEEKHKALPMTNHSTTTNMQRLQKKRTQ